MLLKWYDTPLWCICDMPLALGLRRYHGCTTLWCSVTYVLCVAFHFLPVCCILLHCTITVYHFIDCISTSNGYTCAPCSWYDCCAHCNGVYFHCPCEYCPPPPQAYRQNPPFSPINEYWLLFAIIGGTLGVGVSLVVGILFAVQVRRCGGWVGAHMCASVQ